MRLLRKISFVATVMFAAISGPTTGALAADAVVPLRIQGTQYVNPDGEPVRFWGVNLVALYPEHEVAEAMADNLAVRQINLVRPHHNLRPSGDWNPSMVSGALVTYQDDSRQFDPVALDRFDYLNAALRRRGIYLFLSMHFSRSYLPGDVDIQKTDDADRAAWVAAMEELNGYHWKKSIDLKKMLPAIDERAALVNEEFVRKLMTHVNPYTGLAYAADAQVMGLEVVNESSAEYAIICGNRFPTYWHDKLVAKWHAYAQARGLEGGDLYAPADTKTREARAAFLRELDEKYALRMKAVLRETGSQAPVTISNLWRGENNLQLHAEHADFVEAHMYGDPFVVRKVDDWIAAVTRTALADKPFIIGELNQAEGETNIAAQSPQRTMLPLAASAYGSLHDWSGMVWFAWNHGGQGIGEDGWATAEGRKSRLGRMIEDGMQIDHLRTAGMIFRRGLVSPSVSPITVGIAPPFFAGNYNELMRGKTWIKPGWQGVHGVRKAFVANAADQASLPWMTQTPPSVITSDTQQIVKDVDRRQLVVAAPAVEAFSGMLDDREPAKLKHLKLSGTGFTTVILVVDDGRPVGESARLVMSRTALDADGQDTSTTRVSLSSMAAADGKSWQVRITRPRFADPPAMKVEIDANSNLLLPSIDWHECELTLE